MKRFLLVADLEATCTDSAEFPRSEMETIQFGGVIIDMLDYTTVDTIDVYIKPKIHPKLTKFCTELTHITDETIASKGVSLGEFCSILGRKIKPYRNRLEWAGWGAFDERFLRNDMERANLLESYPLKDIDYNNLSIMFMKTQGLSRKKGLQKALRIAGLTFVGQHHNGFDDAVNTARLLPFILPRKL